MLTNGRTRHPDKIVKAAFALGALWSLSAPIQSESGWTVLIKTGHKGLMAHRSRVRRALRDKIASQKRRLGLQKRLDALVDLDQTEVRDDLLLQVAAHAPTAERTRP